MPAWLSAAFGGCPHRMVLLSQTCISELPVFTWASNRLPFENWARTGLVNPGFCPYRMDSVWAGNSPHPHSHSHCGKDTSACHIQVSTRELPDSGRGSLRTLFLLYFIFLATIVISKHDSKALSPREHKAVDMLYSCRVKYTWTNLTKVWGIFAPVNKGCNFKEDWNSLCIKSNNFHFLPRAGPLKRSWCKSKDS